MPEFIIRAEETDLFFLFKNYEELVRCKNCKWYFSEDKECGLSYIDIDDDGYCSYAERKE